MADHLIAFDAACAELATFDPASIEAALRAVADARSVKAASLIHASRVAVTGKAVSPGLFEVLALLGRIRVRERLVAAARLGFDDSGLSTSSISSVQLADSRPLRSVGNVFSLPSVIQDGKPFS